MLDYGYESMYSGRCCHRPVLSMEKEPVTESASFQWPHLLRPIDLPFQHLQDHLLLSTIQVLSGKA